MPLDGWSITSMENQIRELKVEEPDRPVQGGPLGWILATLGLAVVLLVANRMLIAGEAVPIYDADSQFAPWQILVADYARAGRLLLWNPWSNAGSPDFAEPQFGAFSPITVLIGAVTGGNLTGFVVYWLMIWLTGGVGVLMLARHLGAPSWGGFVVALGFLFCGSMTGHGQHTSHIHALAWLPWIVWRLDVALLKRRWWPAVEAGALWGLSALAGYPGLVLLTACYTLFWALGRSLCSTPLQFEVGNSQTFNKVALPAGGFNLSILKALLSVVILGLVGLAVLSPTYTGFLFEGKGFTDRRDPLPREVAVNSNALHPAALSTLSSPYLSTLWFTSNRKFWAYNDGSSNSIYIGSLVAWLALSALILRPRIGWRWWILGLMVLSLVLALGQALPFRGWLYDYFLPSRYFRHPSIFRGFAIFSMAVLAAIATRDVAARMRNPGIIPRWSLFISAVTLAAGAIMAFTLVVVSSPVQGGGFALALFQLVIDWGGVCGLALLAVRTRRTHSFSVFVGLLLTLSVFDALVTHTLVGHFTIYSRNPQEIRSWQKISERHSASLDLLPRHYDRIYRSLAGIGLTNKNLPLKVPVLRSYTPLDNHFHKRVVENKILAGAALGSMRIWFSPRPPQVPVTDAAFDAFADRANQLQWLPLVIHSPEQMLEAGREGGAESLDPALKTVIDALRRSTRVDFNLREHSPDRLHLIANCPSSGWLLLTDRWARGWQATVNDRPAELWGGNFIFRALPVRRGLNDIQLAYHPFGYPILLILSWSTLTLVFAVSVVGTIRARKPASADGLDSTC